MVDFTADAALQHALAEIGEPTRILDGGGNVIGYFTPAPSADRSFYAEARASFDAEEMQRRKQSGGPYYTTRDVLDHLKSLGSP